MKITTKFMLALAFVGSLVLTSCKDYDEDNYANQLATNATVAKKLADDIATLRQKLGDLKSCDCDKELVQSISDRVDSLLIGRDGDTSSVSLLIKVDNLIDRIDYLTGFNGEKKTLENVISDIIAKVQSDSNTLAKADTLFREQIAILDSTFNDTLKNYATVEQLSNAVDSVNTKVLKPQIDALWLAVDSLANITDSLQNQIDSLKDARQKLITGIVLQQVYNPAIGSFNSSLTGLNTNMLLVYYGTATESRTFPSFEGIDRGETLDIRAGDILFLDKKGNAGTIYLTINPVDQNFDKLAKRTLELVNSQDEKSGVKLEEAKKSDKVLKMGYTRAADNGFYEVPATLDKATLNSVISGTQKGMTIGSDKTAVAKALKSLVSSTSANEFKVGLVNCAGNIYSAMTKVNLDALGVKTEWTDSLGKHSVSSEYKMAACAIQPLGFYTADEYFHSATTVPGYNYAVKLIKKIADKFADKLKEWYPADYVDNNMSELLDRRIKNVKYDDLTAKVDVTVEYRLHKSDDYKTVTFSLDANDPDLLPFVQMVDFKALLINAQRIINEANGHYQEFVINGGYEDFITSFLDNLNQEALSLYNDVPQLFKPKLIIGDSKGFTACGVEGVPSDLKNFTGEVKLYPISYTDGLLAPIYKKYVKIDNQKGKIYDGDDRTCIGITGLSSGVHKVYYSALDYFGKEYPQVYEFRIP